MVHSTICYVQNPEVASENKTCVFALPKHVMALIGILQNFRFEMSAGTSQGSSGTAVRPAFPTGELRVQLDDDDVALLWVYSPEIFLIFFVTIHVNNL